jgi:hypothetical protein
MVKTRLIIISMVFIFLFNSILVISVPVSSAETNHIIRISGQLDFDWSLDEYEQPILPRNEVKKMNISMVFTLSYGGFGIGEGIYLNYMEYKDRYGGFGTGKVELEILDHPSWCNVALESRVVGINVTDRYETKIPIYICLDEDAPGFTQGAIQIKARLLSLNNLLPLTTNTKIFNLSFIPSYLPSIDVDIDEVNIAQISPYENAVFPIKIKNLGNDNTRVSIAVSNLPKGWTAVVTNVLFLEENESGLVILTVRPPKNFGYLEETGIIRLSITPSKTSKPSLEGDTMSIGFLVRSKGFSVEGQGAFSIFGIIIFFIIIIIFIRFIAKRKF